MPPKGSKRGADGKWVLPAQQQELGQECAATPQGKPRGDASAASTATKAKRRRVSTSAASRADGGAKLSAEHAALVNVAEIRKELNQHVKDLATMVDDDWHDSYEQTDEMLFEWLGACAGHVGNVFRVGVEGGAGFGKCHEVLKTVMDSWFNIQAIPFRCDPGDSLGEGEGVQLDIPRGDDDDDEPVQVHSAEEAAGHAWPLLLARAAADDGLEDATLLQMIKDAHDHGVKQPHMPSEHESVPESVQEVIKRGRERVAQLVGRGDEWAALPTTRKVHRMRRCIDRRFDGPRHRRTRDFGSDGEGGEGCSLM